MKITRERESRKKRRFKKRGHQLTPVKLFTFVYIFRFLGQALPSARSWLSLLVIVLGAVLYVLTDDGFQVGTNRNCTATTSHPRTLLTLSLTLFSCLTNHSLSLSNSLLLLNKPLSLSLSLSQVTAYMWVILYFISLSTEMVYVKFVVESVEMTTWGRV
jgi:hypothetical protein